MSVAQRGVAVATAAVKAMPRPLAGHREREQVATIPADTSRIRSGWSAC